MQTQGSDFEDLLSFFDPEAFMLDLPAPSTDVDSFDDLLFANETPLCDYPSEPLPSPKQTQMPLPLPQLGPETPARRGDVKFKRSLIPETAVTEISAWITANMASPYPHYSKKMEWCEKYSLPVQILNVFLTSRRRRLLGKVSERRQFKAIPAFIGKEAGTLYLEL